MGVYLSTPNTDKESSDGKCDFVTFGASSMQGWRQTQEDAHNCILDFDGLPSTSLFAVYDGHGGSEVAHYCATYLPDFIKRSWRYKANDLGVALENSFMEFDAELTQPDTIKQLKRLAGYDTDIIADEVEAEKQEAALLAEEATMPLEEVLSKYTDVENSAIIMANSDTARQTRSAKSSQGGGNVENQPCDKSGVGKTSNDGDVGDGKTESGNLSENICKSSNESKGNVDSGDVIKDKSKSENKSENCNIDDNSTIENIDKHDGDMRPDDNKVNDKRVLAADTQGGSKKDKKDDSDITGDQTTDIEKQNKVDEAVSSTSGSNDIASHSGPSDESIPGPSSSGSTSKFNVTEPGISSSVCSSGSVCGPKENTLQSLIFAEDLDDDDSEASMDNEEMWEDCSDSEDNEDAEEDEDDGVPFQSVPFRDVDDVPGSESGCTALVAVLRESRLVVANVGDSRCVLCRDGKAVDLSVDHKPEDEVERTRIESAGGKVTKDGRVNGGLNLSRALGDHFYKANKDVEAKDQMISAFPDIQDITISPNDEFLILACDGIWNVMNSQEAVNFVKKRLVDNPPLRKTPSKICEEMFDFCMSPDTSGDGTGCDNMTCIIVLFNSANYSTYTPSNHSVTETIPSCDQLDNTDNNEVETCNKNGVKSAVQNGGDIAEDNQIADDIVCDTTITDNPSTEQCDSSIPMDNCNKRNATEINLSPNKCVDKRAKKD